MTPMRLFVRSSDGSLKRPEVSGRSPDFSGANDGALVLVDGEERRDVGLYLMSGDDTHPPTHYSYEVELYALHDALVIRAVQRGTGQGVEMRISYDQGRSWRLTSAPSELDAARLLDQIEA
jgi:hypothetical protein